MKKYESYSAEALKFYKSAAWQHKRAQILRRDHFECQDCRERIRRAGQTGEKLVGWQKTIQPAQCVHHIQELSEHPELALTDSNLISLCHRCHDIRHDRYGTPEQKKKKPAITEEKW